MTLTNSTKEEQNKKAKELRELLVPTHLYYDIGSRPLRVKAMAEIITKVLYLSENKEAKKNHIKNQLVQIFGAKMENEQIVEGLDFLYENGQVDRRGKYWILKAEAQQKIEHDLAAAENRIDTILDRYFGSEIEREVLVKWFKKAGASIFAKYGDIWAKTLYHKPLNLPDNPDFLNHTLYDTITALGLQEHSLELVEGFKLFLHNYEDTIVRDQIWSFAQAMLSAKLINASLGADPITLNEFRDSYFILDTNVLMIAALEQNRLAPALNAFASSLEYIGARLCIIRRTSDEYESAIRKKQAKILKAIDNDFSLTVIEASGDSFFKTAIGRKCRSREDFDTFFKTVQNSPTEIDGANIELLEYPEIHEAVEKGVNDKRLLQEIATAWDNYHRYHPTSKPKHQRSLEHDLALEKAVAFLRKQGHKAWVISQDRSMQILSTKWSGPALPTWLSLDSLIQIFALSAGGPGHQPENFAPLLSTIIEADLQPGSTVFDIADLNELHDAEEKINELSDDDIINFATETTKLRLAGKNPYDGTIQVKIRRTFQHKKIDKSAREAELAKKVNESRQQLQQQTTRASQLFEALIASETPKAKRSLFIRYYIKLALFSIVGALIIAYGIWEWQVREHVNWGGIVVAAGIVEFILQGIFWAIPGYKFTKARIPGEARKRAQKLADNQ